MAERVVSIEVNVHVVEDKQFKVGHQTSHSETDDNNSIQQTATSTSADDDCGYLLIVSDDVLSAGESVKTVNTGESDVTDSDTHSQCNIQHEDSNSATGAGDHMYMIITDDNEVSTPSLIQCHVSYNYLANTLQAYQIEASWS
jgi:hypothetical protein